MKIQSILSDFCFLIARITASVTGQSFQIQLSLLGEQPLPQTRKQNLDQ